MAATYDLVIVGMGSAGITAAEFAATLGLRVAVAERDRVGGDCLWTGCVPSKALLASAKAAHTLASAQRYGLPAVEPEIDTALVWKRLRAVQADIAATDDNPDRFSAMGIELVTGTARLAGPHAVVVDGRRLRTRFVLVCTGSRPAMPGLAGLAEAGFLTSENLFELERAPRSVTVIGGGPIAVEMAQALCRLGVRTTVLQKGPTLLPRDEPGLVKILTDRLRREGVEVCTSVETQQVMITDGAKLVEGTHAGRPARWSSEELLVAAGRRPAIEGLGLEDLGIEINERGIMVDGSGRTALPSVYAVGDVAGGFLFTHSAAFDAVQAVRDMFFPGRGHAARLVPWCTFTDPELAHVGLTEAQALEVHGAGRVQVHRFDLAHSDRGRADGTTEGAVTVVTARGNVVGAHVLAPAAGEMIHEYALAIHQELRFDQLAGVVHVYPTLSTTTAQLAGQAAFASAKRWAWLARRPRLPLPLREWLAQARRRR